MTRKSTAGARTQSRRAFLRRSAAAMAALVATTGLLQASDGQGTTPQRPKEGSKEDKSKKGPAKKRKRDAAGREYEVCPQCGFNMYKQGRTWTCENCGYSYVE